MPLKYCENRRNIRTSQGYYRKKENSIEKQHKYEQR